MKTRACFKCWKYVNVDPSDSSNQKLERRFDIDHKGHGVLTMENSQVRGRYTNVTHLYAET